MTGVGLAVAHGHTGELLIEFHRLGHVREVQLRVHPWVNRFMAMVTMSTLPVRSPLPKRVPSMRCPPASRASSPAATAVPGRCGVDGDNDVLPAVEMLAHVLNLLGIDVGHGHLHGGGEVDDDLPFRPGAARRR